MIKTIFIIGERTNGFSARVYNKFKKVQLLLEEAGYRVINPIDILENTSIQLEDAIRTNIKFLLGCDAVYIMPCVRVDNSRNLELSLAIQLDLLLIHGANYNEYFVNIGNVVG